MADEEYIGHRAVTSSGSDHNTERLHIEKVLNEHRTNVPVKIVKVYPGQDGGAPTADVQVLIDQVDGVGASVTPHAVVYGVVVGRAHSSAGTVVADPQIGDCYHMAIADRDISKLKSSGQQSSPDTKRRGSLSDGMLTHAILAGKPKQALDFKDGAGVKLYDGGGATVETSDNGNKVVVKTAKNGTFVLKDDMVYLGGDPDDGGAFDYILTVSGPMSKAKGKIG